jgi:hypothetical protein
MLPKATFPAPFIKLLFFDSDKLAVYPAPDYADTLVQHWLDLE